MTNVVIHETEKSTTDRIMYQRVETAVSGLRSHDGHLVAGLGAVLMPPPPGLMHHSRVCPIFWDENVIPMPDITLETLAAENIQDGPPRLPEERLSVKHLIFDPWLTDSLGVTEGQLNYLKEHWLEADGEELRDCAN
ncbi:hypothetical protein HCDG_03887 [Histoplasma capsulatum H143]|uniref:Uncharacterized protein n=1 Tax=Ajellomyces capsulatus (strain H143) TaxID=544712 RepID=C6HB05_AJECH|nr:hypothetical protein HCDG_03887 [Histoplasma capsulatum H143]